MANKTDITPKAEKEKPRIMCVVCGGYEGDLTGSVTGKKNGEARWHADCEAAYPLTVAKVKARVQ